MGFACRPPVGGPEGPLPGETPCPIPLYCNPLVEIDCHINLTYSRSTLLRDCRSVKFPPCVRLYETVTQTGP